jgi:hypothetical protein
VGKAEDLANRLEEIVAEPPGRLFSVRRLKILSYLKEAVELLREQSAEIERLKKEAP